VEATAVLRPALAERARARILRRPSPGVLCFLVCLAGYLVAASFVAFTGSADSLAGDGVSRVAIANRILFSADPHLAAIGFVWSPIPELALLPLVALRPLWPALVTSAFAGTIVSALFMAGAVAQMLGLLGEIGVGRRMRWVLTAGFALHPLILLYAANGMSEASFIFFLLLVSRKLNEWLLHRQVGALVATGFYLGFGYLTRYEASAAAVGVVVVVGVATFASTGGTARRRIRSVVVNALVVVAPFAAAFLTWAAISWLITGSALAQFSSTYGNQAQLQTQGLGGNLTLGQVGGLAAKAATWTISLEPVLPLAAIAALAVIFRRRRWKALGVPAVLGAVMAFMTGAFVTGKVEQLMRFLIIAIPLTIIVIGLAVARLETSPSATEKRAGAQGRAAAPARGGARRRLGHGLAALLAVMAVAVSIPSGSAAILYSGFDTRQAYAVQAVLNQGHWTAAQRAAAIRPDVELQISRYMDSLNLPRASVLLDDFIGYIIPMTSTHPDQYVITSDRDFLQVLADPGASGIRYVLIPENKLIATLDAINRAYPNAYATGQGIGTLVRTFYDHSDDDIDWRLYRLVASG
jgi:hypothetical protein